MNLPALLFFVVSALSLLVLPRKWAPVPLLVSCCYMTTGQGIQLGLFSLPVYRMVLGVGVLRVLLRGEGLAGHLNTADMLMIAWGGWVLIASLFHQWAPGSGPVFASGFIFNICLVYFLIRIWCRDLNELMSLTRIVAFLLVPVALAMIFEHIGQRNLFSMFGGVPEGVYVRDGAIRSQGPFQHPILAGTVGAVCFPLMVGIFGRYRFAALVGGSACLGMMVASTSSGPIMSLIFGLFAIAMWRWRQWSKTACVATFAGYLALEVVMSRPAYYIISKFDLTGSSTGWYRSRLIESTIEHLSEWWLFGTDRTNHWMHVTLGPGGQQTDITNYYIFVGVIGGLPAMVLLIAMMWRAFRSVGELLRASPDAPRSHRFMIWCLGAGLFAHACTSLSVAYFDQSMMFFWLNVAVISSMHSVHALAPATDPLPVGPQTAPPAGGERDALPKSTRGINPVWQRSRSTLSHRAEARIAD